MSGKVGLAVLSCSDPRIQRAVSEFVRSKYGLESGEYFLIQRGGLIPHARAFSDCPCGISWDMEVLAHKLASDGTVLLMDHTDCAGRGLLVARDELVARPEHDDLLSLMERINACALSRGINWTVDAQLIKLQGAEVTEIVGLDEAAGDAFAMREV